MKFELNKSYLIKHEKQGEPLSIVAVSPEKFSFYSVNGNEVEQVSGKRKVTEQSLNLLSELISEDTDFVNIQEIDNENLGLELEKLLPHEKQN